MKANHTYIIAEVGVNHNGSVDQALKLIDAAVASGADAVKFQTYKTENIVCRNAAKANYQLKTTDAVESQYKMLKSLELDEQTHRLLIEHCGQMGIQFLSSPFDLESIDLLANKLDLPLLKLPSGEINNAPLLLEAAQTNKKIILSTGMSSLDEIEISLGVLAFGYMGINEKPSSNAFKKAYMLNRKCLKEKIILLHCTTEYPAPLDELNLRVINTMRETFELPIGYSDHSDGILAPIVAVSQGAVVIEKHLTLNKSLPGPDHKASLEPLEFKEMVNCIRQVEVILGSKNKTITPSEIQNKLVARKSLVAARDIKKGEKFTIDNLAIKRPGGGISPLFYWDWLGKKVERDYKMDEMI